MGGRAEAVDLDHQVDAAVEQIGDHVDRGDGVGFLRFRIELGLGARVAETLRLDQVLNEAVTVFTAFCALLDCIFWFGEFESRFFFRQTLVFGVFWVFLV